MVYREGERGAAVHRILSSHDECYFDVNFCFRGQTDPLTIPESLNNSYDNNTFNRYDHVDVVPCIDDEQVISNLSSTFRLARKAKEKLFFITSHNIDENYEFNYIFCYVSDDSWTRERATLELEIKKTDRKDFSSHLERRKTVIDSHINNPFSFCIDAFKLLSLDNQLFEEEYNRIINHFNFTSNRENVRQFVLTYRNREKQLREWHRKNSFPVPSQL